MGTRGRGSLLSKADRAAALKSKRRFPWKKKGLSRVERNIAFLEFLPITKGKLAGTKMKLLDGQREFVTSVYGPSGEDEVILGVKSEPRGNGKTGLVTGLCLSHLLGPESEVRGAVYSAAIDRQQAGIVFEEMEAIILAVPEFAARVNIQNFHKKIQVQEGDGKGSVYEALSSDARRAHGLAPTLWIYDEFAQARDRVLLDNLMTGMGKRNRSLGLIISTQAASDEHPLSQIIDDGLLEYDKTIVVQLQAATDDCSPFTLKTLRSCNPALGIFLDERILVKEAKKAKRIPAFEAAYRNLRLNQRIDSNADRRIVTRDVWKACPARRGIDDLGGRICYGGLDLSKKHDLTSLTLVFPDDELDIGYDVLSYFWTPEGQLENRPEIEEDKFRKFIRDGHITALPGKVIKFRHMAKQIGELQKLYDIRAVGYDRWKVEDFKSDMEDEGIDIPLEPHGQGFKDMGNSLDYFIELALSDRLRHGDHPVLTACVANAVTVTDPAGNMKIDKDKSMKSSMIRIDGAVTLAMALGVAKRFEEPNSGPSVYEERGVLVL